MDIKHLLSKSILELQKSGIPTPELDAKVLLLEAMKINSSIIYSHPEYLITNIQYSKFRRYIKRRKTGEPIAYILGQKEFYGYDFFVNKNVLVPRPESEWLVEKSIAFLQNHAVPASRQESRIMNREDCQNHRINILDIGTGSGNIIISIVKNIHNSQFLIHNSNFYASDISKKAIAVAKKNSKVHNVEKYIKFYNSDLFSNRFLNKKFDLVIANLPYVPYKKLKVESRKSKVKESILFEPQDAIFADDNGAAIIKRFLMEAKSHVDPNGLILLELDPRNAKKIFEFAKKHYPKAKIELEKDLASKNRYLILNF